MTTIKQSDAWQRFLQRSASNEPTSATPEQIRAFKDRIREMMPEDSTEEPMDWFFAEMSRNVPLIADVHRQISEVLSRNLQQQ